MQTNNKMREAVKKLLDVLYGMGIDENTIAIAIESTNCQMKSEPTLAALKEARAALAEPVRNYEVGTPEDQVKRHYAAMCDNTQACPDPDWSCAECFARWAHTPYKAQKKVAMSDNYGNSREPQEMVWVLSITHDGLTFPKVYRTFDKASDAAIADMREHEVEDRTRNYQRIREMIYEDVYYYDDCTDTAYHFDKCELCK